MRGDAADASSQVSPRRERVERETADVAIALLLLCDRIGIDLVSAVRAKVDLNRQNYPASASRGVAERARDASQ